MVLRCCFLFSLGLVSRRKTNSTVDTVDTIETKFEIDMETIPNHSEKKNIKATTCLSVV